MTSPRTVTAKAAGAALALAVALLLPAGPVRAQQYIPVDPNPYGERALIVPVPASVPGVEVPHRVINDWYYTENPDESVFSGKVIPDGYAKYTMEKAVWAHRTPNCISAFLQRVAIPADFAGQRVIVRFNGTTHECKLYVNGRFVRLHWGSYGSWTADITDFVEPGTEALIALRMDQRPIGLAAYVRFSGNIYEDTELYAVPQQHIQRLRLHTDFDASYRNATLQLWLKTARAGGGRIRVALTDADGRRLAVSPSQIRLPDNMDEFKVDLSVTNPKKWDAEHPNLYRLTLSLLDGRGRVTETLEKNVGFRKLERVGRRLYVNGQEVKFRGIWGVDDARRMRDLNINHVRHKYMTEKILDSCDVYGVYVLHENSVDFAKFRGGQHPQYARQWLDLLADMMERDYSHPSVLMWGLGNESYNDAFTLATHKYAKFDDPDRQTMFSWANRIAPDEEIPYDVYSYHYGSFSKPDFDAAQYGVSLWHSPSLILERAEDPQLPVIFDESTHVVISTAEAGRDPNVRNFWGESILHSWEQCWRTDGVLGLDQFGMFTDIPNWDMPEQWLMRKAYSPFVIAKRSYDNPGPGNGLTVEVENRFFHTDLSETRIAWKVGDAAGEIPGPKAAPRERASFTIPYLSFRDGDVVELAVRRADGVQVDEYRLEVGAAPFRVPVSSSAPPRLEEADGYITVTGRGFVLTYDRYAGQITSVDYKGRRVITGGPHLQLLRSGLSLGEYWPQSTNAYIEGSEAVIDMDVIYSPIAAAFQLRIDADGLMTVHYTLKHIPDAPPRAFTIPWDSADTGGYSEVGIVFTLPREVDRLRWDRRGLWSVYPEDHIGRERGTAYKSPEGLDQTKWKNLAYDFNWMGGSLARSTVSNDFRASKEYIRTADALLEGSTLGVRVLSEERDAVRLAVGRGGDISLYINNEWNYPTLGVGNWMKPPILCGEGYTNTVHLRLFDAAE